MVIDAKFVGLAIKICLQWFFFLGQVLSSIIINILPRQPTMNKQCNKISGSSIEIKIVFLQMSSQKTWNPGQKSHTARRKSGKSGYMEEVWKTIFDSERQSYFFAFREIEFLSLAEKNLILFDSCGDLLLKTKITIFQYWPLASNYKRPKQKG